MASYGSSQECKLSEIAELKRAIEAILMVAIEPIPPGLIAELAEVSTEAVEDACGELAREYDSMARGFLLCKVAGGYRFQSRPEMAEYVEKFALNGQSARLSSAALETLAIIAYKQPISKAQISSVRGVNVEATVTMLAQKGYVAEVARDDGPGRAVLYGTTDVFLEKLGLASVADLPPLSEFMPGPETVEKLEIGLRPAGDPL